MVILENTFRVANTKISCGVMWERVEASGTKYTRDVLVNKKSKPQPLEN